MNGLPRLADDALRAEISSACYFAAVAWGKAKSATRERAEAKRNLAGPLTQGWIGYYQLRRTSLADEIRMYLSARALYRARRATAEAELARRRELTYFIRAAGTSRAAVSSGVDTLSEPTSSQPTCRCNSTVVTVIRSATRSFHKIQRGEPENSICPITS
jgi:hypothetical protein